MKNLPLNQKIFIENRKRFVKEMKPNSIAIFNSNDEVPSNGDAFIAFNKTLICIGFAALSRKIQW